MNTCRPDRDEGEVGYRQCLWLIETFKNSKKLKIVTMHHHLIAAPDTGSDKVSVLDAGDVLHTALISNVKLVLCGHKHRPWIWRLGQLVIVYAGTVSSLKMRGFFQNSYNIIDIEKDSIKIDLKVVGGSSIPLESITSLRESIEEYQ